MCIFADRLECCATSPAVEGDTRVRISTVLGAILHQPSRSKGLLPSYITRLITFLRDNNIQSTDGGKQSPRHHRAARIHSTGTLHSRDLGGEAGITVMEKSNRKIYSHPTKDIPFAEQKDNAT